MKANLVAFLASVLVILAAAVIFSDQKSDNSGGGSAQPPKPNETQQVKLIGMDWVRVRPFHVGFFLDESFLSRFEAEDGEAAARIYKKLQQACIEIGSAPADCDVTVHISIGQRDAGGENTVHTYKVDGSNPRLLEITKELNRMAGLDSFVGLDDYFYVMDGKY